MQFFLVIIAEKIKDAENTIQRIKMQTFWPRSVAESAQLGYRSLVGGFSDGVAGWVEPTTLPSEQSSISVLGGPASRRAATTTNHASPRAATSIQVEEPQAAPSSAARWTTSFEGEKPQRQPASNSGISEESGAPQGTTDRGRCCGESSRTRQANYCFARLAGISIIFLYSSRFKFL